MKFSFQLFFLVATTVVGTISVAAEPCSGLLGKYDPAACDACATGGKGKGQCCEDIYYNSNGRSDDWFRDQPSDGGCKGVGATCEVSKGQCNPGLICIHDYSLGGELVVTSCDYDPTATLIDAASSLLVTRSSTGTTTKGGHAVVFAMVGLLGVALMAVKVVTSRHGVAFRRNQYSEVYATTPIQV